MRTKIGICKKCGEEKRLTRGYCSSGCYCYLIRHNLIERIPKFKSPDSFTKEQEEVFIGSMLGDGSLYRFGRCHHYSFVVARKLDDIKYLEYEYGFFKDFCNRKIKTLGQFDKRTNKTYYRCKFQTRSSPIFSDYHKQWYSDGKKILPDKLSITPFSCSIWFCDDGCIYRNGNRLGIKLATHGFTKEENHRLTTILSSVVNEHFSIGHDEGNYFIYAADNGAKGFLKYVKDHIPVSMSRKVTWTEDHLKQSRSYIHLKNRDRLDLSEKEKRALSILSKEEKISTKGISEKMFAEGIASSVGKPIKTFSYINRFLKYGWAEMCGVKNSNKNPPKYKITPTGKEVASKM